MTPKHHHRCNLCGKEFDSEPELKTHVERRHPKEDAHWWVVVEDPSKDLHFSEKM